MIQTSSEYSLFSDVSNFAHWKIRLSFEFRISPSGSSLGPVDSLTPVTSFFAVMKEITRSSIHRQTI
jgi:hypothetical protein